MELDENWYKMYETLYGNEFNRLMTIGTPDKGYLNHDIKNINDIKKLIEEKTLSKQFFISLYEYDYKNRVITWKQTDIENYEKYSVKNCMVFRFKGNTDVIREETRELNNIQGFMFIRRSINLGLNKDIVEECKKTYDFFKETFDIEGMVMFNGYDECLLYLFTSDLKLKKASLTYHNLYRLVEQELGLEHLLYKQIEPYAQLVPLPGTQTIPTRLYVQIYDPNKEYKEVMKKSEDRLLDLDELNNIKPSEKFEEFIHKLDEKVLAENGNRRYDYSCVLDAYRKEN